MTRVEQAILEEKLIPAVGAKKDIPNGQSPSVPCALQLPSPSAPSQSDDNPGSSSGSEGHLSTDSLSGATRRKKKVNIAAATAVVMDEIKKDAGEELVTESTALKTQEPETGTDCLQPSDDLQQQKNHSSTPIDEEEDSLQMAADGNGSNYLTVTGTIQRGKKAGQSIHVKLNISREELEVLEASIQRTRGGAKSKDCNIWGLKKGIHVFLWTFLCLPFVFVISTFYSFYMGTMTWYNIFTFCSEEKNLLCKVLVSPLLILSYPFVIVMFMFGLGTYSAFVQLSWYFDSWREEVLDIEKGFYGWLCSFLKLEDCSPYTVVVLTDIQKDKKSEDSTITEPV